MEQQTLLILFSVAAVLFLAVIFLLIQMLRKSSRQGRYEELQRLELMERTFYDGLRDLRGEQSSLAQATRMEAQAYSDRLSEHIDKRVARLADLTDKNLERIRVTVDEKLDDSLTRRFSLVSQRLEELHRSLGEMQGLAGGVDDLKRILSNVKTRGIWGEIQLGILLRDILPRGRFAENVEVNPRSGCRVEFALRLPGGEQEIFLPIDAKFPQEDYQRLQNAREAGNADAAGNAIKDLERRLKKEAKDIRDKYICPPYSTDFGIMYLPSEGLFVEALNIPGLADDLQRTFRVCIAGPTTLAALLNSLQMGFKTLAIQEKTDEVWRLLAGVNRDLTGLSESLEKAAKKIEEAQSAVEAAQKRAEITGRKLVNIEGVNDETDV